MPFTQSCKFLMQCCLSDQRLWAFNIGFQPCPLHTEVFSYYLNLLIIWIIQTVYEPHPILACELSCEPFKDAPFIYIILMKTSNSE